MPTSELRLNTFNNAVETQRQIEVFVKSRDPAYTDV
ncbi:hypothetical protein PR003_g23435 [Phytophthora rubi]|nr:hypothetical protein PR001_g23803 [Phytophthora rubi]KAE9297689.1 hypothetical protein PR003_g23435 [Phytophthora rubi]